MLRAELIDSNDIGVDNTVGSLEPFSSQRSLDLRPKMYGNIVILQGRHHPIVS
jgi:hypothetical protein